MNESGPSIILKTVVSTHHKILKLPMFNTTDSHPPRTAYCPGSHHKGDFHYYF